MEKINIAELLKDCPKGMELDCTLFDDVHFDSVDEVCDIIKCYIKDSHHKIGISFNKYGHYSNIRKAKCVIFPKGKTTWEGFQRPFKNGDVVVAEDAESFQLFLLKHLTYSENDNIYDGYCYFGWNFQCNQLFEKGNWAFNRLATEEEKEKLFNVIKANGYKWNEETKTLEKLPKFKVGDKIKKKDSNEDVVLITDIADNYYIVETKYGMEVSISINIQGQYELVPNKFDITTLKPFESRVLVRDSKKFSWRPALYGGVDYQSLCPFITVGGMMYKCMIPYEGNEHLLGTTNDCDEFYKSWKERA